MQVFGIALLLALSAPAEPAEPRPERRAAEAELRHELAIAGLRARQTLPPEKAVSDPCAAAREIVRQPPCLASSDCEALQLWRKSFGAPRIEPLDPDHARYRSVGGRILPNSPDGTWHPTSTTRPNSMGPGFYCPASPSPGR